VDHFDCRILCVTGLNLHSFHLRLLKAGRNMRHDARLFGNCSCHTTRRSELVRVYPSPKFWDRGVETDVIRWGGWAHERFPSRLMPRCFITLVIRWSFDGVDPTYIMLRDVWVGEIRCGDLRRSLAVRGKA